MDGPNKLYRYEATVYSTVSIDVSGGEHYGTTPVRLESYEYPIVKETKCGYWIDYAFSKKFVLKGLGKRFAYSSKEQALESLRSRKLRQISILSKQIARAQDALILIEIERKKNGTV